MLYVFCDEDSNEGQSVSTVAFSAVVFRQAEFNAAHPEIAEIRGKGGSLLAQIENALARARGLAIVAKGSLDTSFLDPGRRDYTDDIDGMSRRDNIWSLGVIFTVGTALRRVGRLRWNFRTVDVYHDPKSLTGSHRTAVHRVLRTRLQQHANAFFRKHDLNLGEKIAVRRIQSVAKPKGTPNKFQLGVWIADRVVRRLDQIEASKPSENIEVHDLSEPLIETVEQWERPPFTNA